MGRTENAKATKGRKLLKTLGIIILIIALLLTAAAVTVSCHTQLVIGVMQEEFYKGSPINSFEPPVEPSEGLRDNGQYMITSVCYGDTYPNSYLNIQYPDDNFDLTRPTIVYIHGGGYFYGSALHGDPMAASDPTALYDAMCADGFNVVSIDYCLVPDHRFPDPLHQLNEAMEFLVSNADIYHLDMDNVVIMGSSAGAIMTSQYGAIITNSEYASLFGIDPAISADSVSALVVDDAPLDYSEFNLTTKVIIGNYLSGSIWPSDDKVSLFEPFDYLSAEYPASFLIGSSSYGEDMKKLHNQLSKLNVQSELCYPSETDNIKTAHCFITEVGSNETANTAYDQMIKYLRKCT